MFNPEIEVINFAVEDIITASGTTEEIPVQENELPWD